MSRLRSFHQLDEPFPFPYRSSTLPRTHALVSPTRYFPRARSPPSTDTADRCFRQILDVRLQDITLCSEFQVVGLEGIYLAEEVWERGVSIAIERKGEEEEKGEGERGMGGRT